MMDRIKELRYYQRIRSTDIFRTLIHSQNYFLARIVTVGLAFLSLPVFTRLFTQEDYGIVSVYNAYAGIVVILLTANIHASVGRYYFEKTTDFDEFLGTTLIFTCITFIINTLVFLLFINQFASLLNLPGLLPILLIFSSLFSTFNLIYFQIIQAQQKSLEAALVSILSGAFSLGLALLFVLLLKENRYLGQIWAYLIIGFGFSLYFLFRILSMTKFAFKKEHVRYIVNFSVPLIPYYLSSTILAFFDRIMINNTVNPAAAGVYSLGYNIAMLLSIVITATQTALMPDYYEFLNTKQYPRIDALIKKVFSLITLAALGLILFTEEIVKILVDEKFHEGQVVVPIVVFGYIFYGMFTVYGRYIGYVKKTIYSSLVLILSGLSNIVLNVILIPLYGYIAAAYSTAISYFLLFLLAWIIAKFVLKQPLTPLWAVWKPTILLICVLIVFPFIATVITNVLLLFIIKIGLWVVYGIILYTRELKKLLSA
ncbi:MAG: oligosaccharide flippase family protein [Candidatus Hodarchaeales archaeon]|jgi:O-antigen/teichoic acid export membrane protein